MRLLPPPNERGFGAACFLTSTSLTSVSCPAVFRPFANFSSPSHLLQLKCSALAHFSIVSVSVNSLQHIVHSSLLLCVCSNSSITCRFSPPGQIQLDLSDTRFQPLLFQSRGSCWVVPSRGQFHSHLSSCLAAAFCCLAQLHLPPALFGNLSF